MPSFYRIATPPLSTSLTLALALASLTGTASAHDGRRFQVEVVNDQLQARGVSTQDQTNGSVVIDPRGLRPYINAQHGHWEDAGASQVPQDDLPGYDIGAGGSALTGGSVTWTLKSATKWENVSDHFVSNPSAIPLNLSLPAMVRNMPIFIEPGTQPNFQALGSDEVISVLYGSNIVSTDSPGSLVLVNNYDGNASLDVEGIVEFSPASASSNGVDLDLQYFYGTQVGPSPVDTLYVLESVLLTSVGGIADSESIFTIFSPDGNGPAERLHFASLYLEEFVATNGIPEPGSALLLAAGAGLLWRRRSRREA